MRRILLATLTLLLACLTTVAWADWAAGATGLAGARLSVVPTPGAPTAEATADDVAVTWPAAEVSGYVVERTQQETGTTQQACGGVVAAASCLDTGVPAGTWTYRVRARMGSWQGQPSPASAAVVVVAPVAATLDISSRVAVPGDDLTVTGSGWPADAAVTVEVGGATLCSAIGSFTKTCALPDLAAGTYPLRAKAGTTVVTSGTLQVVPGLRAVAPLTSPGGQISARGRGFRRREPGRGPAGRGAPAPDDDHPDR